MFARFDENPAMTLQVIKETKRYGRTDARTDNMKTVYPPQTKFAGGITTTNKVCGGYKNKVCGGYNKLTADALTVCLCVFSDAHKNSSKNIFFMCRDLRTSILP